MKKLISSPSRLVTLLGAACGIACSFLSAQAQVFQTYTPTNWLNDPFATNVNFAIIGANTTHPVYQNNGVAIGGNLFGNCPLGATITLTNIGDTAIFSGQVTLGGNINTAGNVQFRLGFYYKGTNLTDTGWAGYMIANPTGGGGGGLYLRNIPNTFQYGSGNGATQPTATDFLFTAGWNAATYDFLIAVTKLSSTATLLRWKLSGISPSVYHYSGRYTNTAAATQGGFSFDQVGLLGGGSTFGAASTNDLIAFTNALVTLGSFGDGTWASDASGLWSVTNNWVNGVPANGSGFIADFSQVNLTADRTVTLDSSRSVGTLRFGATSGSLNNWFLSSSGGSVLTLDTGTPAAAGIAVNQNTATINLPFVSSTGLAKTGAGALVLRGTNTIVGPLNLNGGTLNFLSLSNLPLAFDAISTVNFGGGALQWAPGNTLDVSSQGIPINFNGTAGFDTGANSVTLATSFGNLGVGGLTKLGSGTLTLNNAVFYSGTTTVSNGVLALGSSGSISSTTNITIRSGATFDVSAVAGGLALGFGQTLAGTGTVLGNVSDSSGVIIAPGASAGTLTVNGSLTLNGGGTLNYELSDTTTVGSGVNDLITVTGALNLSGPTTLNLTYVNGAPAVGTYTLMQYGSTSGSVANITPPPGVGYVSNNTVAKTIEFVVTHSPASLAWRGDGIGNLWDNGGTANWIQDGTNQFFFTSDSVTFDNTGSNSPAINLTATMFPAAVTVNASQDYDLTGGGIGSGRLTKSGSGKLILENDNFYSGPTLISSGVMQIGNGGISGTLGAGSTTNNGVLVFNRASDYTYANAIFGTGSITNLGPAGTLTLASNISGSTMNMAGAGSLSLSASNSYAGLTIISSGVLFPRNSFSLGTTAAGTVVQIGGQLYVNNNIDILGESLSLAGTGPASDGALRKGGNGTTTWGGVITLTADARVQIDGGSTLNLTNAAGINAPGINLILGADANGQGNITRPIVLGTGSLTKEGAGTWTIAPTNTYTGKTVINGGILAIPGTNSLGPVSTFTPDYVSLNGGSLGVTTNVTFDDRLRGFTVGGAGGFSVGAGFTLVISNEITGAGTLTKSGAGTLVLRGSNSFSGTLNVDTGANAVSDGILLVANPNAISSVLSPIAIRNNLGGSSTFQLDGSSGNISVTQDISMNGRSPNIPAIENLAGSNTLAGILTLTGAGQYRIQSDGGLLTLSGTVSNAAAGSQSLIFQGNGNLSVTGVIQDDGTNFVSVVKAGTGSLTLAGLNTYNGSTTVAGGTLGGTGTINGPVFVQSGGTLAPGAAIGTFTIIGSLSLAGTTSVEINKTAGTRDQVVGLTSVSYGGTLAVTNLAGALTTNDTFALFSSTASSGDFISVTGSAGAGLAFHFNPTNGVLSVVTSIANTPTNITYSLSGNTLTLSWPASHLGWLLQSQTNSLNAGLSTNWHDMAGTDAGTQAVITVNPANPTVFYRLRHP